MINPGKIELSRHGDSNLWVSVLLYVNQNGINGKLVVKVTFFVVFY
jgi:hypothetical protein